MLDMIFETELIGCRTANAPMETNVKLLLDRGEILDDPDRLAGKLNHLTVIKPDIAFTVSVVSRFLLLSRTTHWDMDVDVVVQILRYLKKNCGHARVINF